MRQKNRFGSSRVPRESGVYEGLGKTRYSELPETQSYSYTRYNAEILQTYCAQCEAARDGYQEPREDAVRTGHEPN